MRTQIAAMLWENWRLTRVELAFRIAISAMFGAAAIVIGDLTVKEPGLGATAALFLVAFISLPMSLVIAKLNGGTLVDGGRPGFPFPFLYARPVRTALLVGVPMAYQGALAVASYVVPIAALGAVFGYDFPIVPVAAWLAAIVVVQIAAYWTTRSRFVQWAVSIAATTGCTVVVMNRVFGHELEKLDAFLPPRWPEAFSYSVSDYSLIAAICAASFALTVIGVARQRHGEGLSLGLRQAKVGALAMPRRAVDLFPLACPTTSRWRAQIWFEMKSSGARVLATGMTLGLAIPALIGLGRFEAARGYAVLPIALAPLVVLLIGGNAFGLRRKQGHTYASPFDATLRFSTGGLAGLKVLVRAGCVYAALAAVLTSFWLSAPLVNSWGRDGAGFLSARQAMTAAITSSPALRLAALAAVIFAVMYSAVALMASIRVIYVRWPQRAQVGVLGTLFFGLVFALAAPTAEPPLTVSGRLEIFFIEASSWVVATAIPLVTILVFWRALAERLLALRLAVIVAIAWAAAVAAFLILTPGSRALLAAVPPSVAVLVLSIGLLPLTVVALAPWAFSRVRHM